GGAGTEPQAHPGGTGVDHHDPLRVHLRGRGPGRVTGAREPGGEVYRGDAVGPAGQQLPVGLGELLRRRARGGDGHPPLGEGGGHPRRGDLLTLAAGHAPQHHGQRDHRDPAGHLWGQVRGGVGDHGYRHCRTVTHPRSVEHLSHLERRALLADARDIRAEPATHGHGGPVAQLFGAGAEQQIVTLTGGEQLAAVLHAGDRVTGEGQFATAGRGRRSERPARRRGWRPGHARIGARIGLGRGRDGRGGSGAAHHGRGPAGGGGTRLAPLRTARRYYHGQRERDDRTDGTHSGPTLRRPGWFPARGYS